MGKPLTKDSKMECSRHGLRRPAFICSHLQHGRGIGFFEGDGDDPEWPFRSAWCRSCNDVFEEQGAWNDVSEGHARIMAICEGCLEEIEARNR
ncbi:hypothetical protein [Shimia sp. Alg240-R146]|uniref:hypothetical protein n=1 Tax=Shimia sp. Alg240-R146 TaxID=2993449 RepID=UPI0022E43629|nr:hypothetical protein [Shimia sp. Alg240-R146]